MQKIISLFQRNYDGDRLVRDEIVPGAEWVIAGEGVATRKWDGTCCLIRGGKLFKRYEVKPGKTPPAGFEPATGVDEITGKMQGWMHVGDGPDDRWHREAAENMLPMPDGTYELVGPKINGNPEAFEKHFLIRHGQNIYHDCPRNFDAIRDWFAKWDIEGIVWHHQDGRMVKIKKKDFGLARKPEVLQSAAV